MGGLERDEITIIPPLRSTPSPPRARSSTAPGQGVRESVVVDRTPADGRGRRRAVLRGQVDQRDRRTTVMQRPRGLQTDPRASRR